MHNDNIKSDTSVPTYYPPAPQKKKSKILWIVIGVIILAAIGVGVSLATRILDPLWNPFRPEPNEVMEKMSETMGTLNTVHSRTKIDITGTEDVERAFDFSMDFTMDTDNTDSKNPKSAGEFYLNFDMEELGISFAGELKNIGKTSYLKPTIIPPIPIPDFPINLSQLEEQWIKFDQQSIKNLLESFGLPISQEMEEQLKVQEEGQAQMLQKIQNLLKGKKLYLVRKEFPDEEIRGVKTYHYLVALNKEEIKGIILESYKALILQMRFGPEPTEEQWKEFKTELSKQIDEFFAKVGEIRVELWIGKEDNLLYKIKGEKLIDLQQFQEQEKGTVPFEGKISIGLEINFSAFNKPVIIEPPEKYKTLEEIFEDIFEALFY